MSKGNVLVTGGSGYIGSHTVVELLQEGYSAIVVDNMVNAVANEEGYPESLKRVKQITGKDLTFYQLDIRNIDITFFVLKIYVLIADWIVKIFKTKSRMVSV